MVWSEQKNQNDDCYFCSCNLKGYNSKRKQSISYSNLQSAVRPNPHGTEVPVPKTAEDGVVSEPHDKLSFEFEDDVVVDSMAIRKQALWDAILAKFVKVKKHLQQKFLFLGWLV